MSIGQKDVKIYDTSPNNTGICYGQPQTHSLGDFSLLSFSYLSQAGFITLL